MHDNDRLKHLIFWNRGSIFQSQCSTQNTKGIRVGYVDLVFMAITPHGGQHRGIFTNFCYSLRPILLFANMDVSSTKMCLDTSILVKSIMGRREY
jgi:hypothetical protein